MTTYTIKIYNQSQYAKSYVVYLEAPMVTANSAPTTVFTNAWRTFPSLTNGGWDSVVYTENTYAYWAQPAGLSAGVTVDSGGVIALNTASRDSTAFVYGEASGQPTGFVGVTPDEAQDGSFQILTGTDFTSASGLAFGMASDNGSGIPSPVATFAGAPNERYNITPVGAQFYVADGSYSEGQVIDVTTVSNNSAHIDFTGAPFTTAIVTQGANGAFSVKYS